MDHYTAFAAVLGEFLRGNYAAGRVEDMTLQLAALRARRGRLFCLGVGGGAANAAHAACDFRKLCHIEAYAPTDGIAELTARANDNGWRTIFAEWLEVSGLHQSDALMVFSVGGGYPDVSACIHDAVVLAKERGAPVLGVVGRPTGAAAVHGTAVMVTGITGPLLTPVTETVQIAVVHALVTDPRLQAGSMKW